VTAPKNPKPIGLPISIPASEALANLAVAQRMDAQRAAKRAGKSVVMNALKPAETNAFARPASGSPGAADRPPNKAERDAQAVKASYLVGDTTPSKVDLSIKDLPGPLLLQVTDIDVYDHNPRLFANEKIEDIEASLKANGFHDALVVTRRREGDRYMLAAGSNTTLRVLQELWRATQDEKYLYVNCIYQPYEKETKLLAQHLGENLNRGDMRFWEVAKGMVELLDQLDADAIREGRATKPMGLREQADALTGMGLRANKSQVALWRFAVLHLAPLGPVLLEVTTRSVLDHIQPRTSALRALARRFDIEESAYWAELVDPVLSRFGEVHGSSASEEPFNPVALCDAIEAALAERVEESVTSIRQMLSLLKLSPELTLADLRRPSPSLVVGREAAASPKLNSGDQAPVLPSIAAAQAPLPLGPGQVRGEGVNPPPASQPRAPAPAATTAGVPATAAAPTAAAPLFAASEGADPLKDLHAAVEQLLTVTGLQDTLRWWDDMPMGFFVEMPDPAIHARRKVSLGSPEFEARAVKTVVWWSLVLMTGQFREGCVPFIDQKSTFFRAYASEQESNPLHGTDIEQTAPELDEMFMSRVRPGPMRVALAHLRAVEDAAACMFEQRPERWRRMLEVQRTA
jgi:ParB family protein of integrating conjugative element (PFGI_1 class)